MGTFASELAPHVVRAPNPRVYADANIPYGVVGYMRTSLGWDVLFVIEHADLRRARDTEHYRLARQLGRTLLTLDHDYEDDRRFPPCEGAGVIVLGFGVTIAAFHKLMEVFPNLAGLLPF